MALAMRKGLDQKLDIGVHRARAGSGMAVPMLRRAKRKAKGNNLLKRVRLRSLNEFEMVF